MSDDKFTDNWSTFPFLNKLSESSPYNDGTPSTPVRELGILIQDIQEEYRSLAGSEHTTNDVAYLLELLNTAWTEYQREQEAILSDPAGFRD